ncbi:hypothetical protein CAPTEDRAFT_221508 [Capitella teleta]|uniref:Transforming growth factor beta regulator 1 n=1 Tax=Capitella teleta TaxID=283909 RepID=R7TMD6_CAPTE|nr:hypothetical protein CAPTEDRAFT_221508 [Capitella teleta]|eukprot:ELT92721.1 hypothetical protein CAPTEDRAFT_221508 [Capitella teleta]
MASSFVRPEEEAWIVAACKVLTEKLIPLHHSQISEYLVDSGLILPGTKSSLETALHKESERETRRVRAVSGQSGVYALSHAVPIPRPTAAITTSTVSHNGVSKRDKHYNKYIRLKRLVKNMVFLNAAICDEVVRLEGKVVRVKDERKFLLRRMVQQLGAADGVSPPVSSSSPTPSSSSRPSSQSVAQLLGEVEKRKKKAPPPALPSSAPNPVSSAPSSKAKKKSPPVPEEKPRAKKGKAIKRFVTPIPLDNTGRPIFPIELGNLTVYCLGEIQAKAGYCSSDVIYPVGFCSTRDFISILNPKVQCLYTCKVYDGLKGPTFELSADDCLDHVISASTPDECHSKLLRAINASMSYDAVPIETHGAEFFGLSHPTIQNLIQYCPGAKKCQGYRWQKFEIAKDGAHHLEMQATVNVSILSTTQSYTEAVANYDGRSSKEGSGSLRNLLTA